MFYDSNCKYYLCILTISLYEIHIHILTIRYMCIMLLEENIYQQSESLKIIKLQLFKLSDDHMIFIVYVY